MKTLNTRNPILLIGMIFLACIACTAKANDPQAVAKSVTQHDGKGLITIEKSEGEIVIKPMTVSGGGVVSESNYAFVSLGYMTEERSPTAMTLDIRFGNENPSAKQYALVNDGYNVGTGSFISIRESTSATVRYESISGSIKIHRFTQGSEKIYLEFDGVFAVINSSTGEVSDEQIKISGFVKG